MGVTCLKGETDPNPGASRAPWEGLNLDVKGKGDKIRAARFESRGTMIELGVRQGCIYS